MEHLKIIVSIATRLSLCLLIRTAHADIFEMVDGTKINATIISETPDSYILRAEVLNNVWAEKTILKSKVTGITKVDPSIKAYNKLATSFPAPDLLQAEDYEEIINSAVKPFMEMYPSSPHFIDAERMLTTLTSEYNIIQSGGIKLNGKMLNPDQMEADKYNVQASILEHNFMKFSRQKQYRAALSTLERLEDGYPDSKQCRNAQKTALIILPIYLEKLHKTLSEVDILKEKRLRALDTMTNEDSIRTKKIFDQEERQYQHLLHLANFNKKKAKWLPINKYYKEPILNNIKMVDVETKRINIESQRPSIDIGKYYRETYSALEVGDYDRAKENFDKFKKGKPLPDLVNELEPRLKEAKIVMDQLVAQKKEADALAAKLAAEEKARLAKEAREAAKNAEKEEKEKSAADKVRDKLNINKKHDTIDKLSE